MCEKAQDTVLTARHTKWQGQRVDYSCIISLTCKHLSAVFGGLTLIAFCVGLCSTPWPVQRAACSALAWPVQRAACSALACTACCMLCTCMACTACCMLCNCMACTACCMLCTCLLNSASSSSTLLFPSIFFHHHSIFVILLQARKGQKILSKKNANW
jgi:hypothetical protein